MSSPTTTAHAEIFHSLGTGQQIFVTCDCDIGRDHTHLEYRLIHPGRMDPVRTTAEVLRGYLATWKKASLDSRSARVRQTSSRAR